MIPVFCLYGQSPLPHPFLQYILCVIKHSQLNNTQPTRKQSIAVEKKYILGSQKNHMVQLEGDQKCLKMLVAAVVRQKTDALGVCLCCKTDLCSFQ